MKILLDTNVILDVLLDREPFKEDSLNAMKKAINEGHILYIFASAVTDIFYILKKANGKTKAINHLKNLLSILNVAEVNENCILNALNSKINDYKDAVVDETAVYSSIDLILTRNIKDFKEAKTIVMTPSDYLKEIK